jgi:hypothetical protein
VIKHKPQSGFALSIILSVILVIVVVSLLGFVFWRNFMQPKISVLGDEDVSNLSNSQIITHLQKTYPSAYSLDGPIYNYPYAKYSQNILGPKKIIGYEYQGRYFPKDAHFSLSFDITVPIDSKVEDTNNTSSIDSLPDSKGFIELYNTLGHNYLLNPSQPNFGDYRFDISDSSTDLAGYKFGNLFLICSKGVFSDGTGCRSTPSINTPQDPLNKRGSYLFYYDETKKEWSILSDDGIYFMYWVESQDAGSLSQIDWSKSPIKPYGQ